MLVFYGYNDLFSCFNSYYKARTRLHKYVCILQQLISSNAKLELRKAFM